MGIWGDGAICGGEPREAQGGAVIDICGLGQQLRDRDSDRVILAAL